MKTQTKKLLGILTSLALTLSMLPGFPGKAYAVQYQFNDASIELSDSNPASASNWTVTIKTVQAIPAGGTITITPVATEFTIAADMDYTDLDVVSGGAEKTLAGTNGESDWGVAVTVGTSGKIVITVDSTDPVTAATTIVIEIGTNATAGDTGDKQITNPAKDAAPGTADIWTVDVTSKTGATVIDTIDLLVATVEDVDIYGAQKPQMDFSVVGKTAPDGGDIGVNYIEWREVAPGVAKTAVMTVEVNTDAHSGFTVYVKQDHNMQHSEDAGIDIDPIKNGDVGTNDAPVSWASPTGTTIAADTAFLGYTTSDTTLNNVGDGVNRFTTHTKFAGLTSTSEEVLYHGVATQADVDGANMADVTFQLETNNLQPSGNYQNEITFIAKPIF
jgi:hypothetical protein